MKTKPIKCKSSVDHEAGVISSLRKNPKFGAEYLNAALEDCDQRELLMAMRRMAEAYGGVSALAKKTNLHAKTLFRTLSAQGNPELKSLTKLLRAMGMQLAVKPIKELPRQRRLPAILERCDVPRRITRVPIATDALPSSLNPNPAPGLLYSFGDRILTGYYFGATP